MGLAACDPGWNYVMKDRQRAPRRHMFVVPGVEGASVYADASQFTVDLRVELEVVNLEEAPLLVRPGAMRVFDSDGKELTREENETPQCEYRPAPEVALAAQESCMIKASYRAPIDRKKMREISIVQKGLSRGGKELAVQAKLQIE